MLTLVKAQALGGFCTLYGDVSKINPPLFHIHIAYTYYTSFYTCMEWNQNKSNTFFFLRQITKIHRKLSRNSVYEYMIQVGMCIEQRFESVCASIQSG